MNTVYPVMEMPLGVKSIRMKLEELEKFCTEYRLPMFSLNVEEHCTSGVPFPVSNPWIKYFTLKWDWCIWASGPDEDQKEE